MEMIGIKAMVTRQVLADERPWQAPNQIHQHSESDMRNVLNGVFLGLCGITLPLCIYVMSTGGL